MEFASLTEQLPVNGPYVYGYLRHTTGGLVRHTALVGSLTEYCRQHELTLCGVFTERAPATVIVRSPSFVGLLDTLELPHTYGVVIPARSHLGPKQVADERERQIAATNARLITVRPSQAQRRRTGATSVGPLVRQRGGAG
ncbi:hypothetical protein [Streptomyces venezuelae]